jgi:EmrB/QacA subfamily drug resistance transporter
MTAKTAYFDQSIREATGDRKDDKVYRRRWLTLAVMSLSLFIIVIDNTILNVGLPTLVRDLHATSSELQWIVDAYVLVFAGLLLTAGSLGDRFGRRKALLTGLAIFGAGSVAAALSQNALQLIAFRAFMGIGAAFIMPATLSIITNVFDEEERVKAIGAWTAIAGVGIVAGPTIGGWLLEHASWHYLFLVNLPVVALAALANPFLVPESKDEAPPRLDVAGSVLSITGLAALLFAIIEAPDRGWISAETLATFAVASSLLGVFIFWELRTEHPMLDVNFFKNPRFSAASSAITLVYFALSGMMFFLTQHLQLVEGYSTLQAGLRLLPVALSVGIASPMAAAVARQVGTKAVVTGGLTLVAVGLSLFAAMVDVDSGYTMIAATMVIAGVGMGFAMTPATDSIMGSLPKNKAGVGSAVNDTTREIGGALGVAILGSLLSSVYTSQITSHVAELPAGVHARASDSIGGAFAAAATLDAQTGGALIDAARHAYVSGESLGIIAGAACAVGGALMALFFLPSQAKEAAPAPDKNPAASWSTARPGIERDAALEPVRVPVRY